MVIFLDDSYRGGNKYHLSRKSMVGIKSLKKDNNKKKDD